MYASKFEGFLYSMLSEEPFANHRLDMTDENNDYNISDYVSHYFGIAIGETWTCLTCHTKKPKVLNDDSFIFPLEEISQKGKKTRPIAHEKNTHLVKNCVTTINWMDNLFWENWVEWCYMWKCSKSSGLIIKANFEKTISTEITNATKNISSKNQF